MRVAFAGTPEFALPALEALRAHYPVVGVLTQPDRRSGRGQKLTPSPVKSAATAYQLPLAQPRTLDDEGARTQLAAWCADVLVVAAYGLILPREVLQLPRLGCINIHASLLPRWRGAAPVQRAVLAGDTETGVSIMQMDAGLDTGPVLLQRRLAIRRDHTGGSLQRDLAQLGAAALIDALAGLDAGTLIPTAQPDYGVTYAHKIAKAEARIDWTAEPDVIERQVRAFNPWPVAEASLDGEQLRVFAAHALPDAAFVKLLAANEHEKAGKSFEPGTIVGVQAEGVIVRSGRGYVALTRVQRPGRRVVSAGEFARGLALTGRRLG